MKKIYSRNCPKCGSPIVYARPYLFDYAISVNSMCKSCKRIEKENRFKRNCPSCGTEMFYNSKTACSYGIKANTICFDCKHNIKYQRVCPRCNNTIDYELKRMFDYASVHNLVCKPCKEEQRKQNLTRICPLCQKTIQHKHRSNVLFAQRNNLPCKKCSARIEADKLLEKERVFWTEIFGIIPKNKKIYERWKQIWYHRLTVEEQLSVLNKTIQQKVYFWGHIKRKNKAISKRNVKEAFVKWCGDNHWMKRPEVLEKVIKSCEKYKGDHHWFRMDKMPVG